MIKAIYDLTGPDGGYVIADYGEYARAIEYIHSSEFEDEPGDRFMTIERSIDLCGSDLLSRARRAIGCTTLPLERRWIIESMFYYGYSDTDSSDWWEHGIRSPYTPNFALDACERLGIDYYQWFE